MRNRIPHTARPLTTALLLVGTGLLGACADTKTGAEADTAASASVDSSTGDDGSTGDSGSTGDESARTATLVGQVDDRSAARSALGGAGTVSAVATVVATSEDGVRIGEAEVMAEGHYEMAIEPEHERVLLSGLDATGAVVVQGLLVATGDAGERRPAPTLDTESSLEAAVWATLGAEADEDEAEAVDMVDLMARIDGRIAAAVGASMEAAEEAEGEEAAAELGADAVIALAAGVSAAQEAEARVWSELGIAVDQEDAGAASAQAAAAFTAALAADDMSTDEAEDARFEAILEAMAELGISAEDHARAEQEASAAFRLAVEAVLEARGHADSEVEEAAEAASGEEEARALAAAVMAHLEVALAGREGEPEAEEERSIVLEALAQLRAETEAAEDGDATAGAFADFSAAISAMAAVEEDGSGSGDEDVVSSLLDLVFDDSTSGAGSASLLVALEVALMGADEAHDQLSLDLQAAYELAVMAHDTGDDSGAEARARGEAMAEAVTTARDSWESELTAALSVLVEFMAAEDEAAIDLVVWSEGAFSTRSEA